MSSDPASLRQRPAPTLRRPAPLRHRPAPLRLRPARLRLRPARLRQRAGISNAGPYRIRLLALIAAVAVIAFGGASDASTVAVTPSRDAGAPLPTLPAPTFTLMGQLGGWANDLLWIDNVLWAAHGRDLYAFEMQSPTSLILRGQVDLECGDVRTLAHVPDTSIIAAGCFPAKLTLVVTDNPAHHQIVGGVGLPDWPRRLAAEPNTVFVAAGETGIVTVDVRDPSHPAVATVTPSERTVTALAVADDTMLVAEEGPWESGLRVLRREDDEFVDSGWHHVFGGAVDVATDIGPTGHREAYIASRVGSLWVFDVEDAADPTPLLSVGPWGGQGGRGIDVEVVAGRVFVANGTIVRRYERLDSDTLQLQGSYASPGLLKTIAVRPGGPAEQVALGGHPGVSVVRLQGGETKAADASYDWASLQNRPPSATDGRYAYLTDGARLLSVDLTRPRPRVVGTVPMESTTQSLALSPNTAHLAVNLLPVFKQVCRVGVCEYRYDVVGARFFNLTDPAHPQEAGRWEQGVLADIAGANARFITQQRTGVAIGGSVEPDHAGLMAFDLGTDPPFRVRGPIAQDGVASDDLLINDGLVAVTWDGRFGAHAVVTQREGSPVSTSLIHVIDLLAVDLPTLKTFSIPLAVYGVVGSADHFYVLTSAGIAVIDLGETPFKMTEVEVTHGRATRLLLGGEYLYAAKQGAEGAIEPLKLGAPVSVRRVADPLGGLYVGGYPSVSQDGTTMVVPVADGAVHFYRVTEPRLPTPTPTPTQSPTPAPPEASPTPRANPTNLFLPRLATSHASPL